jgi:hydroxymethylbilane synthase
MHIKLGTRRSLLARTQSTWLGNQLVDSGAIKSFELIFITTTGDQIQDRSLAQIGGKGLFVKEIEEALLKNEIDIAVHSLKDVPYELPQGLELVCFPERETPNDVLITKLNCAWSELPANAVIGTSSLRRSSQLAAYNATWQFRPLRGNVDTRLAKLEDPAENLDGIMLAGAGLKRLGKTIEAHHVVPVDVCMPAIGQGTLAIEACSQNVEVLAAVKKIHHGETASAAIFERAVMAACQGSCQVPIAAHAILDAGVLNGVAMIASLDGQTILNESIKGPADQAQQLAQQCAEAILDKGGRDILVDILKQAPVS